MDGSNRRTSGLTEEAAVARAIRSCEAQGVPVKITDPAVIRQVVILFGPAARQRPLNSRAKTKRVAPSGLTDSEPADRKKTTDGD